MQPAVFRRHWERDLPAYCRQLDPDCPLDRWISYAVKVLRDSGIETYESCQGGKGHAFLEPTIRFYGTHADGFRAIAIALTFGLPVRDLRRFWHVQDGEPVGPNWELTFWKQRLRRLQREAERSGRIR